MLPSACSPMAWCAIPARRRRAPAKAWSCVPVCSSLLCSPFLCSPPWPCPPVLQATSAGRWKSPCACCSGCPAPVPPPLPWGWWADTQWGPRPPLPSMNKSCAPKQRPSACSPFATTQGLLLFWASPAHRCLPAPGRASSSMCATSWPAYWWAWCSAFTPHRSAASTSLRRK